MEIVAFRAPDGAPALFEGLRTPAERLERMVAGAFAMYERGSRELHIVRREPDLHPPSPGGRRGARGVPLGSRRERSLDTVPQDRAVARAMIDLNTCEALRGAGLDAASAGGGSETLATRVPHVRGELDECLRAKMAIRAKVPTIPSDRARSSRHAVGSSC
jgi:hypothetical protein